MTSEEWITAFAAALDVPPPDGAATEALLTLAGTAAHQSQRTAAPIACYLVGRAGLDPREAAQLAEAIAAPGQDPSTPATGGRP